jgi:hypothetical protein
MSATNIASYSKNRLCFLYQNNCHIVFKTVSYCKRQTSFYKQNIVFRIKKFQQCLLLK